MTYSARSREPNQILHRHGSESAGGINGFVYRVILFATGVILAIAGVAFQTRAQETSPSAEHQPTREAQASTVAAARGQQRHGSGDDHAAGRHRARTQK